MAQSSKPINTAKMTEVLRDRVIQSDSGKILISKLSGSDQERDLSLPPNCEGLGRIRHFRYATAAGWPSNSLPIEPARRALGWLGPVEQMTAQVFQNAACPWRCWYCFVPFNLLNADENRAEWKTARELIKLYQAELVRPPIIDLSGGSPDLTPEWTVWMMSALEDAELESQTYLWSDDNLSTTYLFDKLNHRQLDQLQSYRNYGRVFCLKGFDASSFRFNTQAAEEGFGSQLEILSKTLDLSVDLYGYVTLTGENDSDLGSKMSCFLDQLQSIDVHIPLRIIPLRIGMYGPVQSRMTNERAKSIDVQEAAIGFWNEELSKRFSKDDRTRCICDVPLKNGRGGA